MDPHVALLATMTLTGSTRVDNRPRAMAHQPSISTGVAVDELTFARPVSPRYLRIIARGPAPHDTIAAKNGHAGAASAEPSAAPSSSSSSVVPPATLPALFNLEVWALQSDHDERTAGATGKGAAGIRLEPSSSVGPWPWENGAMGLPGWHAILFSHTTITLPRVGQADSLVVELNQPSSNALVGPFRTRRLLIRGNYQQMSMALYGRPAEGAQRATRREVSQKIAASLPALTASSNGSEQREKYIHPCFLPATIGMAPEHQAALLFDYRSASTAVAAIQRAWTDQPAVELFRSSVNELAGLVHQYGLETNGEAPPACSSLTDAQQAELRSAYETVLRVIESMDEFTRDALARDQDETLLKNLSSLLTSSSFLLATGAPSSALIPPRKAHSPAAAVMCAWVNGYQSGMPIGFLQVIGLVVAELVSLSGTHAQSLLRSGSAFSWILGWTASSNSAASSSAVHIALRVLERVVQHPESWRILLEEGWLPAQANGGGQAGGEEANVLALMDHGMLSTGATGKGNSKTRDLISSIRSSALLHSLFRRLHTTFYDLRQLIDSSAGGPWEMEQAWKQHAKAWKRMMEFLEKAEEGSRAISSCFLLHSRHFSLPTILHSLLDFRVRSAVGHLASEEDVFESIIAPMVGRGFVREGGSLRGTIDLVASSSFLSTLKSLLRSSLRSAKHAGLARKVREVLEWSEGSVQAMMLLARVQQVEEGDGDAGMQLGAWVSLSAFVHGHPFGVEHVAAVLRSFCAQSASAASSPSSRMRSLFLTAFHSSTSSSSSCSSPTSSEAGKIQAYAADVLRTLCRSVHAPTLFLKAMQLPKKTRGGALATALEVLLEQQAHPNHANPNALLVWIDETDLRTEQGFGAIESVTTALMCMHAILSGADDTLSSAATRPDSAASRAARSAAKEARSRSQKVLLDYIFMPRDRPITVLIAALRQRLTLGANTAASLAALQSTLRCVDALFLCLSSALLQLGSAAVLHRSAQLKKHHSTSLLYSEEGEIAPPSFLPPRVEPLQALVQLGEMHAELWKVWERLATMEVGTQVWVADRPSESSSSSAAIPALHSSMLSSLPRIRSSLLLCLSHTLWSLHAPPPPRPTSVLIDSPFAADRLRWFEPPREEPRNERWLKKEIFPEANVAVWTQNVAFVRDVVELNLDAAFTRGLSSRSSGRATQISRWRNYMAECFWPDLLQEMELPTQQQAGAEGDAGGNGGNGAPTNGGLLSAYFLSETLRLTSCSILQKRMVETLEVIVDHATPAVGWKLLRVLSTAISHQAVSLSRDLSVRASKVGPSASSASVEPASITADQAAQAFQFKEHHRQYHHLQMLHHLLRHQTSRVILNELEILTELKPWLSIAIPATATSAPFSSVIQEIHAFQLIVLECILAAVDSSVLRAHSKQVVVDGDVNFNAVRTILPLIVPFLLQQHTTPPSLSLLALRIFVALSHTHPGSIECLTALSSENHTTGSDAANQEETMGGQEQQVQQQPGGRKTVLYALLEWKVGELERMGSPSVPMSDTPSASAVQNPSAFLPHLDFLGHLAELLMCLITCGSVSAHPTASFTALHTGTLHRGLSIPAQFRPGQDDVWLAMTVSQLFPGLAAVAAVCGCPVRSQFHPPGDPSLVHYLHQNGLLPSLIAPDHPLPRLTTWFDQQLAQANALPPSVCLQLTSLRSMFSALLVRLVCCGHLPIANLATGPSALQVPQREWTLDQRVERVRKSGGGTGEASSASEEEWRNNMREAIESDDASTSQLHANHESRMSDYRQLAAAH